MIKLDLTIEELIILVDLLDTAISEIHVEILRTDNRDYRIMLQDREQLLKKLHASVKAACLPENCRKSCNSYKGIAVRKKTCQV